MTTERELVGKFIDAAVREPEVARGLLAAHPAIRTTHWNLGQTALHFLCVEGFTDAVALCLENKFDPNATNETALHFLCVEGFTDAVALCLENKFDPNATNEFGDSPLIDACLLGHLEIVDLLIKNGADPSATSETRDCPLNCSISNADVDLLDMLLSAGADPHYTTVLGETIFDNWPNDTNKQNQIKATLAKHGVRQTGG